MQSNSPNYTVHVGTSDTRRAQSLVEAYGDVKLATAAQPSAKIVVRDRDGREVIRCVNGKVWVR